MTSIWMTVWELPGVSSDFPLLCSLKSHSFFPGTFRFFRLSHLMLFPPVNSHFFPLAQPTWVLFLRLQYTLHCLLNFLLFCPFCPHSSPPKSSHFPSTNGLFPADSLSVCYCSESQRLPKKSRLRRGSNSSVPVRYS